MNSIQNIFVERVEAFLRKNQVPPSRFGIEVVGDPNFVSDIRGGRSCSLRMVDRVMKHIDEYKEKVRETDPSSYKKVS